MEVVDAAIELVEVTEHKADVLRQKNYELAEIMMVARQAKCNSNTRAQKVHLGESNIHILIPGQTQTARQCPREEGQASSGSTACKVYDGV